MDAFMIDAWLLFNILWFRNQNKMNTKWIGFAPTWKTEERVCLCSILGRKSESSSVLLGGGRPFDVDRTMVGKMSPSDGRDESDGKLFELYIYSLNIDG